MGLIPPEQSSLPSLVLVLTLTIASTLVAQEEPSASLGEADTVHVAPPTGEREADRASILAALEQVRPGGTVQFAPGTYLIGEFIHVRVSQITLLGHPRGTTLRGCDPDEWADVENPRASCNTLELLGSHQTVRNLTFEYMSAGLALGPGWRPVARLEVGDDEHLMDAITGGHLIEGNTFRESQNGVNGSGKWSEPVVIRDNRFINMYHAIRLAGSHIHLLDNDISVPQPERVPGIGHPGLAVQIAGTNRHFDVESGVDCEHNVIAGNRIEGHPQGGLYLWGFGNCRHNSIRDNKIVAGSAGLFCDPPREAGVPIALWVEPVGHRFVPEPEDRGSIEENVIEGNHVVGAEGLGVVLYGASRNRIVNNTISGVTRQDPFCGNLLGPGIPGERWRDFNGSAIWLSAGSDGNEIVDNTFEDIASYAVYLEGDENVVILENPDTAVRDVGNENEVMVARARAEGEAVAQVAAARTKPGKPSASGFVAPDEDPGPGAACQRYREPPSLEDGWRTGRPEGLGLGCDPLEAMSAAIERGDYRNVHAVLIAKDGRLVYEEYFTGTDRRPESSDYGETVSLAFDRNTLHTTRSAGKSFTSAVVGAAVASGAIASVRKLVLDFFPELVEVAHPAARATTLEHLLTMSAGFDWNEGDIPYTDPANHERALARSEDPARFVLGRPVISEPGSRWAYNSGLPVLLGAIVHRATKRAFGIYARENLFEPLGIQRVDWTGPVAWAGHPAFVWDGDEPWSLARSAQPAGSLWLRPRDMLKFGYLYLNEGWWNGRRVLPEEWVTVSLQPHVPRSSQPITYPNGTVRHAAYGYQWMHDVLELPYGAVTVHSASGNGGQKIWVVPDLGLTAVHLAGNYNVPGNGWEAERLLLERILPWAMGIRSSYRHQPALEPVEVDSDEWPLLEFTEAEIARYAGMYEESGQRVEIRAIDGRLQLLPAIGMGPIDLVPRGDRAFALGVVHRGVVERIYLPEERLVFVLDDDGRVMRYEITGPEGVSGVGERIR